MSTSYNRDAFSDLMEQLRMQGTPMGETNARGKSSIGTVATPTKGGGSATNASGAAGGDDFFTNLVNAVQTNQALTAAAQTPGSSYPGFSVGDIDSTAYMPATGMEGTTGQTGITTGFSSDVFGNSQFQQPVNFAGASNALDTVYMSDVFGADSPLVTDLSGGVGSFYGPDKLYPGDVGAGYDPDAYWASQGVSKNPITGKIIDISKYNVTGGEPTSSTAGQAAAPTGTDQVTVTGQRGTGISGVLPSAGVTAIDVTGKRTDDETVVGGGPTVSTLPAGDDITAIDVIGQRTDDKEEETTFFNTALNTISTVSGVPLDKVYEVVTTAEKPKDLILNALDSLGITLPEFNLDLGTTGETFEVLPENLLPGYFDPAVTDGSGMNDNTTAGTGGGDGRSIPQRTAIRSVVPGTYDPNRRAGSGGQRYFSDVQYVPNVADPAAQRTANLAAQAQRNTQAMDLALANARNPARQAAPGATDVSLENRVAALLGQTPTSQVGAGLAPTAQTTGTAVNPNAALEELVQTLIAGPAATGTTTGTTGATTGTTGATTGTTGATTGTTGATTGTTGTATTGSTSPYTYTSESLFQGIDPSDGFDETEIGRVAALMNQNYTDAGQVSEFFNMSPEDVNRYLGDYNKRTELIKDLGLTEGQQGFTFDQLSKIGASGLENQYLADTFGVDADALQRAIGGASTITGLDSANGLSLDQQGTIAGLLESGDVSVNNVAKLYGISPDEVQSGYSTYKNTVAQNAVNETIDSGDFDAIAELVTSNKAGISDVASRQGTEGMDVVEQLLRGGYETPAQMAARLAPANEGLTEVDLVANLLNTGRAKPEEVASYYRNTDPEQFADLTAQGVEQYLADINKQNTTDYLKGLSDEEVGALINSGELDIGEAVKFYQDRYPGLTLADAQASMKAMRYAQGGNVQGYYLGGPTDGMADQIPATINNMQPAALSDGEFVIPADVVSHLGNGNSESGAKELYGMMDRIREDRTGTTKQGRQIDPNKYLA